MVDNRGPGLRADVLYPYGNMIAFCEQIKCTVALY